MTNSQWSKVIADPRVRKEVARESHLAFFSLYLASHMRYKAAPFQKEFFKLSEDESNQFSVIEAFRGSAKSTIMNLSYPIWSLIGKQQHKFILILAQTQTQSRQYLTNIKKEFEDNDLLRVDFGPFEESNDEWRSSSIVLPRYDARIMAASLETPVRGLKHKSARPSLIIVDDLEDLAFVKSRDNRDKAFNWLFGDVIPMGETDTRVIVIGTRLHEDSLIMRLRKSIEEGTLSGVTKRFPLLDDGGHIAWPGKYKNEEDIKNLRKTIPSESTWQREYLLNIVSDDEPVVRSGWIKYYETFLGFGPGTHYNYSLVGIDLAIREGTAHDYTAMVTASVYDDNDGGYKVLIHANPINKRMDFPTTMDVAKTLSNSLGNGQRIKLIIESVSYQLAAIQQLREEGYPAEEYRPRGEDKRQRLSSVSAMFQSGKILFPQYGCEELIKQIVNFGFERYDDLVDAFTSAMLKIIEYEEMKSKSRIIVPGRKPVFPVSNKMELEKEADQRLMAEQDIVRSSGNNPMAIAKQRELEQNRRNRDAWKEEERQNFRRLMRGY